jgi:peptidoglycan/LPS O-acetylase OafA/YrhL
VGRPLLLIAVAFPPTLLLAILSWRFVEHPVLARRHLIGARLTGWVARRRRQAGAA